MDLNAGNKGLVNLGNTCYMNSALQCLSHLLTFHPFNEVFQAQCVDLEDCLMKEWFHFQTQMWSNEHKGILNPMKLLRCFQQKCSDNNYYFDNFQQNDADEFLTLFLDLLHQGIKRTVTINLKSTEKGVKRTQTNKHKNKNKNNKDKKKDTGDTIIAKARDTWRQHYGKDYSYVVQNFSSQLLLLTVCPQCEYYTTNHDPIQVLSIGLPEGVDDLRECLVSYTNPKYLDQENAWTCDQCKVSVCPQQRTLLWQTSDILVILLKRYQGGTRLEKNNRYISFPDILDLNDICISKAKSHAFALQGMCIQDGSLGGGHYYAICKNHLDRQWYSYNDTHVRLVSTDQRHKTSPYLFFYKRV